MSRMPHPVWIRSKAIELEAVLGDCLASPVNEIDVTVANEYLDDPMLEAAITCLRYADGEVIQIPFPLLDSADTNSELLELGLDSVKIALDGLCATCPFRSTVG